MDESLAAREARAGLLVEGLMDWSPVEFVWTTISGVWSAAESSQKRLALEVVRDMLLAGEIIAGDLVYEGFRGWPEGPQEQIDHINSMGDFVWSGGPSGHGSVWVANTARGDELARRILNGE